MPSPEHTFQSHIVFAPDNKTDGIPNGTQLEPLQHFPLIETASTNQHLEALKPRASALLGLHPDTSSTNLESTQSIPSRQSVPIDADKIREKRHEQLKQTGSIPPIVGGATDTQSKPEEPNRKLTPESQELTWGERLSKDGFWVLDYLHIGYSKYIRELAEMEGIDLDAGLEELRRQGLLDESNPECPGVKLPRSKLTPR